MGLLFALLILLPAFAGEQDCESGGTPSAPIAFPAKEIMEELACDSPVLCSDGLPFLHAQQAVDGDLMAGWLARQGKLQGTVVALLDSGFDGARIDRGEIRVEALKKLRRGEARMDEIGHGTAVTSLISGSHGIGLSPNARVWGWRITNPRQSTQIGSILKAKALEACLAGAEVINVSFGSIEAFEDDKAFLHQLEEKGCLLVKAAGNLGIEQLIGRKHWSLFDPVLRVEGIDSRTGNRPRGFDKGEWAAPAVDLATWAPLDGKGTTTCNEISITRNSGSSGAAPIVSGILAEVISVLKRAPWYVSLSGPGRVALMTRILDASRSSPGGVSGYKAVRLASALADSPEWKEGQEQEEIDLAWKKIRGECPALPPAGQCGRRQFRLLCEAKIP